MSAFRLPGESAALDRFGVGVWSWDRTAGLVNWDRRLEEMFGFPAGTFPGTVEAWMARIAPDDRAAVVDALTARRPPPAADPQIPLRIEYRCVTPDGSAHRVETHGALQLDEAGNVVSGLGITLAVDRRDEREGPGSSRLESAWQRLARLQDLVVELAAASTVDDIADILIGRGMVALEADGGFFSVIDRERRDIVLTMAQATPRWVLDRYRTIPLESDTPLGHVARTGRPVFISSDENRRATFPGLEWEGAAAFVVCPMFDGDEVSAMLVLGFAETHHFGAEDRELISTIVGMSSSALKRAELHDASQRAAKRSSQLERAAARLAGAATAAEVGEILVEELVPMVGAAAATLYLFDEAAPALRAVVLHGFPDSIVAARQVLPISARTPPTAAFRDGEPVTVAMSTDWRSSYPQAGPMVDAPGVETIYQLPLIAGGEVIGTLGFGFDGTTHLDGAERQHLGIIATICAQAMAKAIALSDAQRANTRLASIDEITDAALSQLALEDLLQELPRRVATSIGCDTVRIMLLDDDGAVLHEQGSFGIDKPSVAVPLGRGLAGRVAATGKPLVFDDLSHQEVVRPSLPEHIATVAGFPLQSGGRVIGVLDVGAGADRPFTADDVELLGLAGDRIATAIERSRAFEIERAARQHADLMVRLGEMLSAGGSVTAVARRLVRLCADSLADWCVLTIVTDSGTTVDAAAHTDPELDGDLRALVEATPFDAASVSGAGAVVRSGDFEMTLPRDPGAGPEGHVQRLLERVGDGSHLTVPLLGASRIVGALRLARTRATFTPADIASIQDVAGRIGVAIESRLSHDRHRDAVMALQRSLLPGALPDITGADVATGYWPASDEFDIGGDFFDVIDLGPDRWGILIGDISGKGIEAAAMTGIARQTARAAARHGLEPVHVLHWIHDAFVEQRKAIGSYCSAVYGVLETIDGAFRFSFTVGGHPLPIVRPARGAARYVGATGTVLGLIDPIELAASEVTLSPGDWLVLYTDGVTDVPIPDAIDDQELLGLIDKACLDSPDTALASLEQMLKARYEGVANRDDTALVIVRCTRARPRTAAGRSGR